ncbi:MAG: tetraacyldisaccharide 4'-kinase, partial [Thermodesulfobacteriota bacterium]
MTGLYFWVRDVLSRRAVGWAAQVLFLPLTLPAWGYGKAQALRRWAYRRRILRAEHPGVPVISVGNIAAGGTGKTPCVETICRVLLEAGLRPAVLSRGYKGSLRGGTGVVSDPDGVLLSPEEAGDEPVLLARRLPGVPVLVGRDRRATARLAAERFGVEVVVLDDGFQHLGLARDLDVVLLDARRPFGNGHCFPRGLLREAPGALAEADLVLLTRTRRADSQGVDDVRAAVRRHNLTAPVLPTAHTPRQVVDVATGEAGPLERLRGLKVLAFAGIGTPEAFFRELGDLGAKVLQSVPFPDHHRYTPADLEQVLTWARLMNAQALVTTEKDGVRLLAHLPLPLPVLATRIEMAVLDRPEA